MLLAELGIMLYTIRAMYYNVKHENSHTHNRLDEDLNSGVFCKGYSYTGIIPYAAHPEALWKKYGRVQMNESLTAVFEKSLYGYICYVEELPGANTQGKTLEEAKQNLVEAIQLVLEANRQLAEEEF